MPGTRDGWADGRLFACGRNAVMDPEMDACTLLRQAITLLPDGAVSGFGVTTQHFQEYGRRQE
ncbi:hypothetical protein ACFRCW_27600 [Streptomyces sp. NPDC056653]|uniref:hypothetical protein n=1 Tax=Streptomyces sp. NPDC056653 TaxID=3345894 RepID=UPI0036AC4E4D